MKLFIFIFAGLLFAISAAPARNLRVGTQSVPLTTNKRSTPALAVRIGNVTHYGYLTSGTAPGRLTIRLPNGNVHSLIAPPATGWPPHTLTFSTIQTDWSGGIVTFNLSEHGLPCVYNTHSVHYCGSTAPNAGLTNIGIYPTYWVQTMCSSTVGINAIPGTANPSDFRFGNPVHSTGGLSCWCRLKRRSDNANGPWVSQSEPRDTTHRCANNCGLNCPNALTDARNVTFRQALLSGF